MTCLYSIYDLNEIERDLEAEKYISDYNSKWNCKEAPIQSSFKAVNSRIHKKNSHYVPGENRVSNSGITVVGETLAVFSLSQIRVGKTFLEIFGGNYNFFEVSRSFFEFFFLKIDSHGS